MRQKFGSICGEKAVKKCGYCFVKFMNLIKVTHRQKVEHMKPHTKPLLTWRGSNLIGPHEMRSTIFVDPRFKGLRTKNILPMQITRKYTESMEMSRCFFLVGIETATITIFSDSPCEFITTRFDSASTKCPTVVNMWQTNQIIN